MLRRLSVKNFAIIEEQTLELAEGLNVLTGETGAGKSILIEALGFLLGARGSAAWLRAGAARLEVTGWFDKEDFPAELRAQFKIEQTPVLVRRELDASGKTRALINSQSAPLSTLGALGRSLVDFHGQHENQTLLRPQAQLELLDRFGGLDAQAEATAQAYEAWARVRQELENAQISDEERRRRIDFARFQLQELNEAKLVSGEEEQLEGELPRLKNAERLKTIAAGAYEALYEQEGSVLGALLKAERGLAELSKIDASMESQREALTASRAALEEVAHALGDYAERLEVSPGRLDEILGRLELLSRLKKKHGASVEDVIAARERIAQDLSRLENSEARQGELDQELAAARTKLDAACETLHAARMKAAKKLEGAILKELKVLGMPNAAFAVSVEMEEGRYARTGADECEYMLAANPGEPLRPVKEIASGGELSRVMLALKTVLAKADRVPVLVFDEVDAGIGGAVARAVGERLAALGRLRQVLCVTHLPQVACFGSAHFSVVKEVSGGRTRVAVERLDGSRRLEAIALMLGGREATAASRKHAKELLASSVLP